MIFTDDLLNSFSKPLSPTEDEKCKNAIRMVADALKTLYFTDNNEPIVPLFSETSSYSLHMLRSYDSQKITIFVQGSYANNTNVCTESDVDIAVIQEEVLTTQYRGLGTLFPQRYEYNKFGTAPKTAISFKDEVQRALEKRFKSDVERKNKSIKVHGNTNRKNADIVPCFRYRYYYIEGVVINTDDGERIINYPEQHILNGRKKNQSTNSHYKKMVRIMKKMRYLMEDSSCTAYSCAAKNVSSFMLESLLWNIEDDWYMSICGKNRKVIEFSQLIQTLRERKNMFWNYKEANGIKDLCPTTKEYTCLCSFLDQLYLYYDFM